MSEDNKNCNSFCSIPKQYNLESYNFTLPEEQIAQFPCRRRNRSRLLCLNRQTQSSSLHTFDDILNLLPKSSVLVVNNVEVLPVRLLGQRSSGGAVEFLVLTPYPEISTKCVETMEQSWFEVEIQGLARPFKRLKHKEVIKFSDSLELIILKPKLEFCFQAKVANLIGSNSSADFIAKTVETNDQCRAILRWQGDLIENFFKYGHLPLPPYIKRSDNAEDLKNYQTVYASRQATGAIAAPTAGLHFTKEIQDELVKAGHTWLELSLYVGYGTFSPIRCQDIRKHSMHRELISISHETMQGLRQAKQENRPIVAVGTTSLRALESLSFYFTADATNENIIANKNKTESVTDIFIKPGYTFKVVNHLITNFHLPKSSLLILVSALAGRDLILQSYTKAIENKFRFFSYGDAMLIL